MPTHTVSAALVKMHSLNGAPWHWHTWQELTGIRHGLNPPDDKNLPPGWTRQNATDVQSYFNAYERLPTEQQKYAFAVNDKRSSAYPGREFWNTYIHRKWPQWRIHNIVVEELREWEVHPLTILVRENSLAAPWPSADFYIPMVLDPVALRLFGEEAFPNGSGILTTELRRCVQMIVQRSWNSIRSNISTMKNRPNEIEASALAAFKDLEAGKLTKAKVSRAIRAVAKWKECAELFNTPSNIEKAGDMLAELQAILEGLGAKLIKRVEPKGICKVSAVDLKGLATEEDVSDLLNLYDEYFEHGVEDEDEPLIPDALPAKQQLNDAGGDFGMEKEAKMTVVSLALSFGFHTGLPPIFNTHRHRSGITPWDDLEPFANITSEHLPDSLSKLRLHWHQLSGLHSMHRSTFTDKVTEGAIAGILVGDEVGLGKSAQAIAFIAFLIQAIYYQQGSRTRPKVLRELPYLAGKEKIPSLPHLIVCPGTLVAQWVNELKTFLVPRSVDIFVYDSKTNAAQFWGPDGALARSKHKPHHCIIVASHSVLFKEMNDNFPSPKKARKDSRPWDMPAANRSLENTLFGHTFLNIIIDEAHNMRNPGKKHTAALQLLQQATVRVIMTATPLHTSSRDIGAMGRLVGIPHFFTEGAFEEERNDAAAVRRAKKLDDDGAAVLAEQLQAVKRLQGHLAGHFLRRTTKSVDCDGNVLLPLPDYIEIMGILNLTERETKIIQARAEAAKAAVQWANGRKPPTRTLYVEYRTAVGYAKENPGDPFPMFKTLDEWSEVKSTKMDVCAKICAHYLTRDDVEDVSFANGVPVFPDIAIDPQVPAFKTRRIIIYAEFASMAPLLQNVLALYGIPSLIMNGKLSCDNRDKQVKLLYDDKHPARVFIFSSVGSTGLNLSIADTVMFFDQPWSAQDERQIRGRAWRQPQTKNVKVIHMLAKDSADLLMNDVARGKRDMFDAFVNKELREEFSQLLQGLVPDNDIDDDVAKQAHKPRKKSKKRQAPIVVDDDLPRTGELDSTMTSEGDTSMHPSDGDVSMEASEPDLASDAPQSNDVSDAASEHDPIWDSMAATNDPKPYRARGRKGLLIDSEDDEPAVSQAADVSDPLVRYASSPASSGDRSPPTKRPRQGTIGPEGRAQILGASAPPPEQKTSVGSYTLTPTVGREADSTRGMHNSSSTIKIPPSSSIIPEPQASHAQGISSIPSASPAPPRRQFLSQAEPADGSRIPRTSKPTRMNPFARKPNASTASGSSSASRVSTSATSNVNARKPVSSNVLPGVTSSTPRPSASNPPDEAGPSGVPSRQLGLLDEVPVPPRTALKGFRPTTKKSRWT